MLKRIFDDGGCESPEGSIYEQKKIGNSAFGSGGRHYFSIP